MKPARDQVGDMIIPDEALPLIEWGQMERLTCRQAAILLLVRSNPGISAGALAAAMKIPPPCITRASDKLISAGMLKRTTSNLDRRVIELWPVAKKGKKA